MPADDVQRPVDVPRPTGDLQRPTQGRRCLFQSGGGGARLYKVGPNFQEPLT